MLELMTKLSTWLAARAALRGDDGANAIEYSLVAAFVGLAIIGGATALGTNVNAWFTGVSSTVSGWITG